MAVSSEDVEKQLEGLTQTQLVEAKKAIEKIREPSPVTQDKLWLITIRAFAVVLVLTASALSAGLFIRGSEGPIVTSELVLSVVTAVIGFFGGLFTDKPPAKVE